MKNGQKLIEALPNNQKFKLFEPKYNKQMKQLKNMGFNDEGKNMQALEETNGEIDSAIQKLI